MVEHRKNTAPPKAYVPSSWFIVLTVMIVVGGAGWLGWLLVDDDSSSDAAGPTATSSAPAADPTPSDEATDPDPSPETSATPSPSDPTPSAPTPSAPAGERDATVSVLNNSGVAGAARTFSTKVTSAGWTLGGIGNWTGSIGANTVYYPEGLQSQAQLLADDVGIDRVRPRVAPMRPDRLTIILSGPQ